MDKNDIFTIVIALVVLGSILLGAGSCGHDYGRSAEGSDGCAEKCGGVVVTHTDIPMCVCPSGETYFYDRSSAWIPR